MNELNKSSDNLVYTFKNPSRDELSSLPAEQVNVQVRKLIEELSASDDYTIKVNHDNRGYDIEFFPRRSDFLESLGLGEPFKITIELTKVRWWNVSFLERFRRSDTLRRLKSSGEEVGVFPGKMKGRGLFGYTGNANFILSEFDLIVSPEKKDVIIKEASLESTKSLCREISRDCSDKPESFYSFDIKDISVPDEIISIIFAKGQERESKRLEFETRANFIIVNSVFLNLLNSLVIKVAPIKDEVDPKIESTIEKLSKTDFTSEPDSEKEAMSLLSTLLIDSKQGRPDSVNSSYLLSDLFKVLLQKYKNPIDLGKAYSKFL